VIDTPFYTFNFTADPNSRNLVVALFDYTTNQLLGWARFAAWDEYFEFYDAKKDNDQFYVSITYLEGTEQAFMATDAEGYHLWDLTLDDEVNFPAKLYDTLWSDVIATLPNIRA